MFHLCPFDNYTPPPFVFKSYKLIPLMNGTPRFWHVEVKQTELLYKHWVRDQPTGEKMTIPKVLLFAVVVLLFRMACSKSVREVSQIKGKTCFEELFVYTNDNAVRI